MSQQHVTAPMTEERRREIFAALVAVQDGGHRGSLILLDESRRIVCERFGVNERQLRQIEREGLENDWPPFSRREEPAAERADDGPDRDDEGGEEHDPTA